MGSVPFSLGDCCRQFPVAIAAFQFNRCFAAPASIAAILQAKLVVNEKVFHNLSRFKFANLNLQEIRSLTA